MMLVLVCTGIIQAANTLKVKDVEITPGESMTLSIELENETTNLMGWQCDIVLPEGLSLELKPNGKPAATLGERFSTTEHTISSNRLANGAYRFIATSMDGEAIPGYNGTLFSVTLKANASLTSGTTMTCLVTNVEFNTQDNKKETLDDAFFSVTLPQSEVIDDPKDGLAVQDLKVTPGESVTLNIELENETTNLMGWQCDIVLPEGLSLELKPNGKPAATLGERFSTTGHTISSNLLANGAYRFIATSMDGEAIPGYNGTLFSVTLKADALLSSSTFMTGRVTNIEFNTQDNKKRSFADASFSVTINKISKYKLIYVIDGVDYRTYELEYGASIMPEAEPTKEGYTFSGWSNIPSTMPANDVTVSGTFTVNKYKLTYMVDGIEYESYQMEYGESITPVAEPTKEGFKFSGWSYIPSTMPANDVTVTGTFSKGAYKLTYMVDGAVYKTISYEYGSIITPEAEPTIEGYTFSGWSDMPSTMPANDVTVTGTFTVNKYKLTYMVDGIEYKSYQVEYGASITHEAEPTKDGYTFSGWSEIPATMPAQDVTVTGIFTRGSFKLTYIVDGVTYKTVSYEYGATITPEAKPTKEGYTFSGWSYIPTTMPAENVMVTGSFTINKYKFTYMLDGEVYKTYEIEYGTWITPESEPTKEGYTFSGWSNLPSTMPAKDVTVTGTFTVNTYKLIFYVDGEEYISYKIEYGETITPEAEPSKEGYTFLGWSEIPATMPANDVTVTGTFTINSYKLTYMIDDVVYKEVMYEYGATISPEPQPDGNYVSFEWIGLPETMPANDVTVYASYETGIINLLMPQGVKAIYAPNGKKLDKLQTGVNIILMIDGRTKKVMVK